MSTLRRRALAGSGGGYGAPPFSIMTFSMGGNFGYATVPYQGIVCKGNYLIRNWVGNYPTLYYLPNRRWYYISSVTNITNVTTTGMFVVHNDGNVYFLGSGGVYKVTWSSYPTTASTTTFIYQLTGGTGTKQTSSTWPNLAMRGEYFCELDGTYYVCSTASSPSLYSSTDLVNWTLRGTNTSFGSPLRIQAFKNRIYFIGSMNHNYFDPSSGTFSTIASFSASATQNLYAYKNYFVSFGGANASFAYNMYYWDGESDNMNGVQTNFFRHYCWYTSPPLDLGSCYFLTCSVGSSSSSSTFGLVVSKEWLYV